MAHHYLAFDLGASSGRGIVGTVDDSGRLSLDEVHRFPNGPVEKDGSFYWDFPRLVGELKKGIAAACARYPVIDSLGIDTWGVDYVFFDREDKSVRRMPYNYRDPRGERGVELVEKIISRDELYRRTGMQFMSLNTIYQLASHKAEHPEDFENSFLLFMPDALAFELGGDPVNEYTIASTSNLLDPFRRDWDGELLAKLGIPERIFAPLVRPCTSGGCLSEAVCRELGVPAIPIVKIGGHDTASAVAATPAPESGSWCYVSCGTWALLGAELREPDCSAAAARVPFTNEGGLEGTIRFLANIMGSWLFQETRRVWNEAGKNYSFADMENLAKASAPCKFLINPNCQDFLTPGDMPARVREFCRATGQGEPADDGEVLRAVYDSLALYFADRVAKLGEVLGTSYPVINMVGGGTKDAFLMQLTADASGARVVAGPVEATAIGNIAAQAIASGVLADLRAARRMVSASFEVKDYSPRAEFSKIFAARREFFRGICK